MKLINVLSLSALISLNIASMQNASATNTITFNGKITDATCDVSLEYKGAEIGTAGTGSITLDEVSKGALSTAGSSAGQQPFYIVAKNCTLGTPAKTKIAADFKSANGDNQGYLNNTAVAGATGVQLRLLDSARQTIKVNDPNQSSTTAMTTINTDAGGATKMLYFVEYYSALGNAAAGAVTSDVDYELLYQ